MDVANHLAGRVALVTGGGRGVGRAIAESLAACGAQVVIADSGTGIDGRGSDHSVAETAAHEIGDAAVAFAEDIASPSAASEAVSLAVSRFGGLDILVNNAAIMRDAFVFKADPADWDAVIRNNLSGAYYVIAAATPVLRDQAKKGRGDGDGYRWGRIVNIVSTAGFYGNFGQAAYASAKAGLFGLTRVTAMDMARSNVTCNAVAPFAATRVTETIRPANPAQEQYKERAMRIGGGHVGTFVAWLSTPAADDITGQIFAVRSREVFLFAQPRPIAEIAKRDGDWDFAGLTKAAQQSFAGEFSRLETDLEAFNTEPIV